MCQCFRNNADTIETERQRAYEGSPETEPEIEVEVEERDFAKLKSGHYKKGPLASLLYERRG